MLYYIYVHCIQGKNQSNYCPWTYLNVDKKNWNLDDILNFNMYNWSHGTNMQQWFNTFRLIYIKFFALSLTHIDNYLIGFSSTLYLPFLLWLLDIVFILDYLSTIVVFFFLSIFLCTFFKIFKTRKVYCL